MNGYNFTERVRAVLARTREEAVALNQPYVGTEHMLLGLYTKAQVWWVDGAKSYWADLRQRASEEGGASAVEYGLLVALIAAVIVTIVGVLGGQVSTAFQKTSDGIGG